MSLSSPEFIIFLGVTVILYFSVPARFKWVILLIASYLFAAIWNVQSALILFLSTLLNYWSAIFIANTDNASRKQQLLIANIAFNISLLIAFRYVGLDILSLAQVGSTASAALLVTQTIGISFYTFQQISYNIDVSKGVAKPEKHFGLYAVFVSLFPHLTSGPIDRATTLLPQLRELNSFNDVQAVEGFRLILWGAFKKLVIADRLALYVNAVYASPQGYSSTVLAIATIFYAFQIYADFSGYTDIAIGAAKVLGLQLTANFRQPYFSTSIREFWQRWHISLSNWIRDYLFLPLARKSIRLTRGKYPRLSQLVISIVVMGIVGLWHGAQWRFIIWGVLHGTYLGLEAMFRTVRVPLHENIQTALKLMLTFALVCLAWIFFRASSVADAVYIATHIFDIRIFSLRGLAVTFPVWEFVLAWVLIAVVIVADIIDSRWGLNALLNRTAAPVRWGLYYGLTAVILFFGIWGAPEFIYFRF
jgi:D-alanyl-lipoteichoic acid acyltransferase DltB (MBOAT superfamily)